MRKSRLRPGVRNHGTRYGRPDRIACRTGERRERSKTHGSTCAISAWGKRLAKSGIGPARAAHVIEISNSIPAKRFDDLWDADSGGFEIRTHPGRDVVSVVLKHRCRPRNNPHLAPSSPLPVVCRGTFKRRANRWGGRHGDAAFSSCPIVHGGPPPP